MWLEEILHLYTKKEGITTINGEGAIIKKLAWFCMVLVNVISGIYAKNIELVHDGFWECDVDSSGFAHPEKGSKLKISEQGEEIIKISFTLKPDKENGGITWTWGVVLGYIREDKKEIDASNTSRIILVYVATSPYYILFKQVTPRVEDEGADHCIKLPPTSGKYKKVSLLFSKFKQPGWAQSRQNLNPKSLVALMFQPHIPQGGTTEIKIKKVELIGLGAIQKSLVPYQ